MALLFFILFCLFPGRLLAEGPATGSPVDSLYRAALRLRDDGDRAGAVAALERVLAQDPRRTQAYCHLGHLLVDASDIDGAEKVFRQALDLEGNNVEAYYGLGRVYRRRNKERLKAIQYFRIALAHNPKHAEALYELAMTQLDLDDYDAKGSFEDLIRLDPQHLDAYYELGRWYEKSRRLEDAARNYERQIRVNPGHPMAQRSLRSVYNRIRSARRLGDVEVVFDPRGPNGGSLDGNPPVFAKGQKVALNYRIYFCGPNRPKTTYSVEAFLEEDTRRGAGRSIVAALGRMVGRRWDVFLIPFELAGIPPFQTGRVEVDTGKIKVGDRRLVVRVVDERSGASVERDMVVGVK